MKKLVSLIIVMIGVLSTHGQIELNDTTHHITVSGYAGVLGGPVVATEKGDLTGFVNFRAGGTVKITPKKWFSVYGLVAFDIDETAKVSPLCFMGVTFKPSKKVSITVGKIGSPITELRPLPTEMSGQFEPWTKSHILGSALGGKMTITFNKNFSLVAGGFVRKHDASIELGLKMPHVKIAGYYMINAKTFGVAATGSYKYFSQTVSYNHKQNLAFLTNLNIPKVPGLCLYSDVGLDGITMKMIRGEWGILECLSYKYMNFIIGAGYVHEIKSIRGYVMITL